MYESLVEKLNPKGVDVNEVIQKLKDFSIETPSWGYSDAGTRFKVFHKPGSARNVFERIDDAAVVNKLTGAAPFIAIHIPWDKTKDYKELKEYAESKGITIGTVNPNLFQEDEYKYGSLTNTDDKIRQKAISHILECIEIMRETGAHRLSLWFGDGTNYPGQGDFVKRLHRMLEGLRSTYVSLRENDIMLIEYKFFEPAFYHTDIPDWGTAMLLAQKLGRNAKVLVDLGHHPLGTNIEQIVAILLSENRLGGFHFNDKKYADDDLTTGSINPYQLFLIFVELVKGGVGPSPHSKVSYTIDQSHCVKPNIEAMIQTINSIEIAYAKSLLVDFKALQEAQEENNVVKAEEILLDAYYEDVRLLISEARRQKGAEVDPLRALKASGYEERIVKERG
ncbi:MAG: L-rhamnose isomerase [Synergistetes bacterium]|nr:L-rhamnose isomerase [Synergistota bacterium]